MRGSSGARLHGPVVAERADLEVNEPRVFEKPADESLTYLAHRAGDEDQLLLNRAARIGGTERRGQ